LLSLIIIAFAQPYFAARRETKNEMYIILDNSFSMQAKGKQEKLKRAVQELLEETPENFSF
jgi:Mg-chelatase subunit ChlD